MHDLRWQHLPEVNVEPDEGKDRRPSPAPSSTPTPPSLGRRRQAMRLMRDDNEEMVLVYELVGPLESDPRTLVFEWGRSAFHLDKFPDNWRSLKDDALLGLRHH